MFTWKDRVWATVLAIVLVGAILCAGAFAPVAEREDGEGIDAGAQGASKQRAAWLIVDTLSVQNAADFMGSCIDLDAAGTTSICADTDNQVDIEVNGADDFQFTANTFTALSGSTIKADTIAETTSGSGVTVDGALIKDGGITLVGGLIHNSTTITVTNGQTITPTVYSGYRLNAAGAVTITLAACSSDFQPLYLYGEDNQTITIADSNVRTNDGNAQTLGQYDLIFWMCVNSEWVEVSDSNNS